MDAIVQTLLTWRRVSDRIILLLLTGFMFAVIAIGGLYMFAQSEWLNFAGPFPTGWEGYNSTEFTGLWLFTFFGPISFALLFTCIQFFLRAASSKSFQAHFVTLLFAMVAISGIMIFGIYWASNFIECMGVGCVDDSVFKPFDPAEPEAGIGFQIVVGMLKTSQTVISLLRDASVLVNAWPAHCIPLLLHQSPPPLSRTGCSLGPPRTR
jgi:hypothetical protein